MADRPGTRFAFAFEPAYARAARPFGITPARAWVDIESGSFEAHFGPWRVRTEVANIASATITGPYRFWRTAGPARLGASDLSLTFASNGRAGVEIAFRRRVPGLDPLGVLRHGLLTVTVADLEGLCALLPSHGADT